jgi:hypothetical protein
MDNDNAEDASAKEISWVFFSAGSYRVRLIASGCGGSDTTYRNIYVKDPVIAPTATFVASTVAPTTEDTVRLTSDIKNCMEAVQWTISPHTFSYVNGTSQYNPNPELNFTDTGFYTLTLRVINAIGAINISRSNYIHVIKYCKPLITDPKSYIGIYHFKLGQKENSSSAGGYYQNFVPDINFNLVQGETYTFQMDKSNFGFMVNSAVWIDYNRNGSFTDPAERVGSDSNSLGGSWRGIFTVPLNAPLGISRLRIGAIANTEKISPCGPHSQGEFEDYQVTIVKDTIPPVISLIGKDTVFSEIGRYYYDAGATALDNVDGDLSSRLLTLNSVDSTYEDTNFVYYTVSDSKGNKAIKKRVVIITVDVTPPLLSLKGADTVYIEVYNSYKDAGVNYFDKIDGTNLRIDTLDIVDTSHLGLYYYVYKVSDSKGNSALIQRVVNVVDTLSPVLNFTNGKKEIVEVYEPYQDNDLVVKDNYDSIFSIIRDVPFEFRDNTPKKLDTFDITYTVTDNSGNSSRIARTVYVEDTIAPLLKLKGQDSVFLEKDAAYTDAGYTVSDNYDPAPKVSRSGSFKNSKSDGTYSLSYTASDQSGNRNTVSRIIIVGSSGIASFVATQNLYPVKIYPNPNAGIFTLDAVLPDDVRARIAVYDIFGREVRLLKENGSGPFHAEVNMQQEAAGVYFVRIEMKDKVLVYKIGLVK